MPYVCNNVFSGPTNSVITDSIVLKITTFCVDCSDDRLGRGSTAVLANAEDGSWTHGREDSDAAASIEVPIHDCKKPTCIHADEVAGKYTGCLLLSPQLVLSS